MAIYISLVVEERQAGTAERGEGMKAVLISIQPRWCELIASGKKTVEVRKTAPKLEPPFKCYIYCTKDKKGWFHFGKKARLDGNIICEFVCDGIDEFTPTEKGVAFKRFKALHDTCLSVAAIRAYLGSKVGYGWHISNLVIYDSPKALSEFRSWNGSVCWEGGYPLPTHEIKRAPQSWCYVEELKDAK